MNKQENRIFIIGLMYSINGKNKQYLEALNLYDRKNKKGYMQSVEKVMQRFLAGEPIVGIKVKTTTVFDYKMQDFKIINHPQLSRIYDYRQLSVIDNTGKVLKQGKDVIIGIKVVDGAEKCVVVNNSYEERILDKQEAIKNKLIGVRRESFYRPSMELISN